jgi:hypothetical protein
MHYGGKRSKEMIVITHFTTFSDGGGESGNGLPPLRDDQTTNLIASSSIDFGVF